MKIRYAWISRAVFTWVYYIVWKTLDARRSLPSTPIGGGHDSRRVIPAKAGIQDFVRATANRSNLLKLLALGGVMSVVGCAGLPYRSQEPRPTIQVYPTAPPAAPISEGSVWRDDAPLGTLFGDQKARAVGDLLTVSIVEEASATKEATTQTARASSINAGIEALLGFEKAFTNPSKVISGSLANNFDGSGKTARSGKVTATVTAVVTNVFPNGNLLVEGSREIAVNHERELIVLSGVVRPKDIAPGNTVLSTSLGQMKIAYHGSGVIGDKQRPGWLGRVLDKVWPF